MVRKRLVPARQVRSVRVAGFKLTEGIHASGSSLPWHDHETPTICFVLRGSFTELWRGGSITCGPATLKITPAGERHWDQFSRGDVRGLLIEPDPLRLDTIRPYAAVLDERVSFQGGAIAGIAGRVYDEMRRMDEAAPLVIEGLLLELVGAAARFRSREHYRDVPGWLHEARDIIHADLGTRLSLAGLAQAVGVHPVTLARGFRRTFGCTVGAYLRRQRIDRAVRQLSETDLALAEIALGAGFSDQSHFSNVFRLQIGLSPSQFRRIVRHG